VRERECWRRLRQKFSLVMTWGWEGAARFETTAARCCVWRAGGVLFAVEPRGARSTYSLTLPRLPQEMYVIFSATRRESTPGWRCGAAPPAQVLEACDASALL